jgi:hypothetical protein
MTSLVPNLDSFFNYTEKFQSFYALVLLFATDSYCNLTKSNQQNLNNKQPPNPSIRLISPSPNSAFLKVLGHGKI